MIKLPARSDETGSARRAGPGPDSALAGLVPAGAVALTGVLATASVGVAVLGVAIGSILARGVLFSIGVGILLTLYAALVLTIAWFGWRRPGLATGLVVATNALHLLVGINLAQSGGWAWWLATLVPLTGLGASVFSYRRAPRG